MMKTINHHWKMYLYRMSFINRFRIILYSASYVVTQINISQVGNIILHTELIFLILLSG
jgi:hypothetical protein